MAEGGSKKAGLAEGGHSWPSDEETLEIRVDRIEEKPLGCLQFGNERNGGFNLKEEAAVRRLRGWICSRAGHRETAKLKKKKIGLLSLCLCAQ